MSDKKTVYKAVLDTIKNSVGTRAKTYRTGDPIIIARSDLPMVYVRNQSTDLDLNATGMDLRSRSIEIGVVISKLENVTTNIYENENADEILHSLVEGVDAATNTYRTDSVVGAIRKDFTFGNSVVNVRDVNIIYRADAGRNDTMVTEEAIITMTTEERIVVNNRT